MTKDELFSRVSVKYDSNDFLAFTTELNNDNQNDSIYSLAYELAELFPTDLDVHNYPILAMNGSLTQFGKLFVMRLSLLLYEEFEGFIVSEEYKQNFCNAKLRKNSNDKIFKNFLARLSAASEQYQYQLTMHSDSVRAGILYELLGRYFYKDIVNIVYSVKKDLYLNKKEIKTFMKVMNKICNGVNINTYLKCFDKYSSLNTYTCRIKYGDKEYEVNTNHKSSMDYYDEIYIEDYLFSLFDLEPADYKKENYYTVSMIKFISALDIYEPAKYSRLCDYIVTKIKSLEFGQLCLEKGYSLSLADKNNFINELIMSNWGIFTKLGRYKIKLEHDEYLAYPLVNVPENVLIEGKKISDDMLSNYFCSDNLEEAKKLFYNPETKINLNPSKEVSIGSSILGAINSKIYDFVPEYDTYENRYNRLYIWCYLYKNSTSQYKSLLWERIYSYLLRQLAAKYHLHSIFEADDEKHQKALDVLFKSLNKYGIDTKNASDEFKNNCLISLMDYSYSTLEQDSMFPVLEQIGDAIFDVVITNLLYLDPRLRAKNLNGGTSCMHDIDSLKKKYCSAIEQINIAKELKLDEIYLVSDLDIKESLTRDEILNKFTYYDAYQTKYFADSYEMIIGSIYKEYGLDVAYKFAEDTFLAVYPEFRCVKDLSLILDSSGSNINELRSKIQDMCSEHGVYGFLHEVGDYLLTVKPDFRVKFNDDFYLNSLNENYGDLNYRLLEVSLMKLACIIIMGNDTKDQRKKLTVGYHNLRTANPELSIDKIAVYEFLNNGVVAMVRAVRENNVTKL